MSKNVESKNQIAHFILITVKFELHLQMGVLKK